MNDNEQRDEPTNIDFALATAAAVGVPMTEAQVREYVERTEPTMEAIK